MEDSFTVYYQMAVNKLLNHEKANFESKVMILGSKAFQRYLKHVSTIYIVLMQNLIWPILSH